MTHDSVFISYRREDASGFAGRLHAALTERFGPRRVFRDVDTMGPGADFAAVIESSLESCGAFVAVIGREWVVGTDGRRRLDDPRDWVRLEVTAAIQREGVTVIPVLVEGALMPAAEELPEPMRPLTRYNALELSDSRWGYDVERLVHRLEADVGPPPSSWPTQLRRTLLPTNIVGAVMRLLVIAAVTLAVIAGGRAMDGGSTVQSVMQGNFNIAVAEFAAVGPGGKTVSSPDALALAGAVHARLGDELSTITREGFMLELRSPAETGPLEGDTPAQRAAAAAELASRIRADIVVYGTLELGDRSLFRPEFFVSQAKLGGAEELFGQYELGSLVEASGDITRNPVVQRDVRDQVLGRTRALAEFILGLSYLAVSQPGPALDHFEAARRAPGWDDRDGKEVLYLLLGNAAAKLGDMDEAQRAYDQALALEPEYARARLGQADLLFQRSRADCTAPAVDPAGLRRSLVAFETALEAKVRPALSDISLKASFGRGRAYLCLSQAEVEDRWAEAEQAFEQVVDAYLDGNDRLRELAAESYANLGLVHLPAIGDPGAVSGYRTAAADYARAIDLTRDDSRKALFFSMRGFILSRLGEAQGADDAYRQAIALESDPETRAHYERARGLLRE